jgi:hypothetical protein
MTDFSDDDLIDYVLGTAGERTAEIERKANADEELAAQISIMSGMIGREIPGGAKPENLSQSKGRLKLFLRRFAGLFRRNLVAACLGIAVMLVASGVWAAWTFRHQPLLEDHFRRRSFDSTRWLAPRPRVRPETGFMRLINRGYLVTKQEFEGPIDLRFKWKWIDLAEDPQYSEDLTVALRTTGTPRAEPSFEIQDGVTIRFMTYDGKVRVSPPPPGPTPDNPPESQTATRKGSVPMPSDAWHDVRITDDGLTIAVYITGPELPAENATKPIIKVAWPHPTKGHQIAFYNRELLSFASHESHITDVVVRKLDP